MEDTYILSLKTLDKGSVQYLDGKRAEFKTQPDFRFTEEDGTLHVKTVEAESFISKSDERFKENIQELKWDIEDIMKLEAKEYNYKGRGGKHYGYIAQEVNEILPEIVSEDRESRMYVNYQEMIPILMESVKKLYEKNEELEKKINGMIYDKDKDISSDV